VKQISGPPLVPERSRIALIGSRFLTSQPSSQPSAVTVVQRVIIKDFNNHVSYDDSNATFITVIYTSLRARLAYDSSNLSCILSTQPQVRPLTDATIQ
jgi:hypothetical protein